MKKLQVLAFAFATALTTPVLAETTATGIGTGISGADATLNMGNILSLGSAAAACANNIGPVSWSDNTCERVMLANYWAARGDYPLADEIILADPKVKAAVHSLLDKREASAPPASKTAVSTKAAMKNYLADKWSHLSKAQRNEVCSGAAQWNGSRWKC